MRIKTSISTLVVVLLLSGLVLNTSCKSADSMTTAEESAALAALETQLNAKAFRVDINTIFPFNTAATNQVLNDLLIQRTGNSANRIDVSADGHFIEVSNASTKGSLPFFGEQRLVAGHYNGDNQGIEFDGEPEDYSMTKHKKKNALEIKYHIKDKYETTESYNVQLTIYPNKSVDVFITSTLKNLIRYKGELKPVEAARP
ncbi:MAG: DUF4251 domain-containing protein [Bacteroidota bacterium]